MLPRETTHSRTVLVSPQFAGRITQIVRREGDRVTKGEVLARLEDTSATSNLVQQKAALSSSWHDLTQAKRDLARTSSLARSVVSSQSTVFEIATLDAVRVSAEVDERYVRVLRSGMRAEILPLGATGAPLGLHEKALSEVRNRHLGFVFQFHHLLEDSARYRTS